MTSTWRIFSATALVIALLAQTCVAAGHPSQEISVDAAKNTGTIKRVNDVDNGPLCQRGIVDLSRYYKELGIRNVRLHDVAWTYDNVLDINYIFPDWNADPDRQESYDFRQTDFYIKSLMDLGINIIFRLGYSAEYKTAVRHNTPPDDFEKWADVAAHIVRHYNEGWANGPRANIKYWEIWNEPDGRGLVFWTGAPEALYRLYDTTAKKLKTIDPTLKIGGPAIAFSLPFLEGFLQYVQQHHSPIDFVSWHIYTPNAHEVAQRANQVHQLMTKYGFSNAESIVDEWNYGPADWNKLFVDPVATRQYFDSSQDEFGAAFDATVMTELQDAPVDIATFFSGTTFMWGLFTSSGAPQKSYYSFLAFQRLLETPRRLATVAPKEKDVSALAGISEDGKIVRVLVTNLSHTQQEIHLHLSNIPWTGPSNYEQRVIDAGHSLSTIHSGQLSRAAENTIDFDADGPSVSLFTIRPAD